MTDFENIYAVTDWHVCFDGVDPLDFPDYPDDSFDLKAGYSYQYDASNDEYHSILEDHAAASLLEQVKAGKKLAPWRLKHFTDDHLSILVELLKCDWPVVINADVQESMALAAYKHFFEYENVSVAMLILAHLYHMGLETDDIKSFIEGTEDIQDSAEFKAVLRVAQRLSEKVAD